MSSSVLVVEDDQALRSALTSSLQVSGFNTMCADSAETAIELLSRGSIPDLLVSDIQMGDMSGIDLLRKLRSDKNYLPVILMTAYGDVNSAVEAMRLGACDYLQKPFESAQLTKLIEDYLPRKTSEQVIYEDPKSKALFAYAEKIAKTDSSVLLTGPSGAGKEVMAQFIHRSSPRDKRSFVAINCAAIPENMLEATLFGYEKGAFTGAHQASAGKFEQAQGGTLLLDEISEMDLGLQAKLLRVIQEKEVERIGGKKSIELDVRIIATTNRDLRTEVKENRFREDLFYRLNVFPIACLSLSQRPLDIVPLAESFINQYGTQSGRHSFHLTESAKAKLRAFSWPGNVRELDNFCQRLAVLASSTEIGADDIQFEQEFYAEGDLAVTQNTDVDEGLLGADLRQHEYQIILEALEKCHGKKKTVAEMLGISPRTLRYKLAKMRELGYELPTKAEYARQRVVQ